MQRFTRCAGKALFWLRHHLGLRKGKSPPQQARFWSWSWICTGTRAFAPVVRCARVVTSFSRTHNRDPIKKPTPCGGGLFYWEPGSVLLSHGIPRTIIGAEAFHGPVRDGKAWDHLAMAARQSFVFFALNKLEEVFGSFDCVFKRASAYGPGSQYTRL